MKNPYKDDKSFDITQDKVWYARASFGQEEIDAVVKCLNEFQLSPGKYTFEFEKRIAKLFDKEYAVMTNSGSSALLLIAEILDIKPGDEIVTQAAGFPTTINPFLLKGAKVVLVDTNTYTLSPKLDQLEKAITKKTKAIIMSHIWGATLDMKALRKIANKHKVMLVEDSCDTLGATIDGKPTGYWSDISVTSFYPSHAMTACGGGGMLCLKSKELEKKARIYRDWGRTGTDSEKVEDRFNVEIGDGIPYDAKFFYGKQGYNLKAVEVQAAFGLVQLKKLKRFNKIRQRNYDKLSKIVSQYGLEYTKPSAKNAQPSWLAFSFFTNNESERKELAIHFENNGIQTRPILAGNMILHPAYEGVDIKLMGKTPGANQVALRGIGIGLHQDIGKKEINHIANKLEEFYGW
jgi:CDP-6-deoxy-D-xylo-4-hexulose-3-dehydrase